MHRDHKWAIQITFVGDRRLHPLILWHFTEADLLVSQTGTETYLPPRCVFTDVYSMCVHAHVLRNDTTMSASSSVLGGVALSWVRYITLPVVAGAAMAGAKGAPGR